MTPDIHPTVATEAAAILTADDERQRAEERRKRDEYMADIEAGRTGGPPVASTRHARKPRPVGNTPDDDRGPSRADQLRARMITGQALRNIPPLPPLVDGVLFLGASSLLVGPPKKGKTFLAIDLVGAVLTGRDWQGRKVHADPDRPVVWLAGEGLPEVPRRLEAWAAHHAADPDLLASRLHVLPGGLSLQETADRMALVEVVAELRPQLVVIDTYQRHTRGMEENSNKDAGLAVEALDALTTTTGAHVMVVHHTGKDASRGARGGTALIGAVETELTVSGEVPNLTVKNTAQRTTAEVPPWWCQLVEAGKNPDTGGHLSLVAVVRGSRPSSTTDGRTGQVIDLVRTLDLGNGVTSTTLLAAVKEDLDIGRTAAYDAVKAAVEMGSITQTPEGKGYRYALAVTEDDPAEDDDPLPF